MTLTIICKDMKTFQEQLGKGKVFILLCMFNMKENTHMWRKRHHSSFRRMYDLRLSIDINIEL